MEPVRIAMWSGPRNVSTALMRSWESRGDAAVVDEPFYACYLARTGIPHPAADQVIAAGETDWAQVVEQLLALPAGGQPILYVKLMAHHLLPEIGRDWLHGFRHCFLIREPRSMLASLHARAPHPMLADTGLPQELELFEQIRQQTGAAPPVVDAADLLADPPRLLEAMCQALGVEYTDRMLSWAPGPRPDDGVWAPHWYRSVFESTGFLPPRPRSTQLPAELEPVAADSESIYRQLAEWRLDGGSRQ